jgi:hypothetical protein
MSETIEIDGIHIEIEQGTAGLFYATSPDIKGLLLAEDTIEKVKAAVPGAVSDFRRLYAEEAATLGKQGIVFSGGKRIG